jgi:hypothetical protein
MSTHEEEAPRSCCMGELPAGPESSQQSSWIPARRIMDNITGAVHGSASFEFSKPGFRTAQYAICLNRSNPPNHSAATVLLL